MFCRYKTENLLLSDIRLVENTKILHQMIDNNVIEINFDDDSIQIIPKIDGNISLNEEKMIVPKHRV